MSYKIDSSGNILNNNGVPVVYGGKGVKKRSTTSGGGGGGATILLKNYQGTDGGAGLSSGVNPGDTIVVGTDATYPWSWLYFENLHGTAESPITIINNGNIDLSDSIKLVNCSYIHVTGSGTKSRTYGFKLAHTTGTGWGAGQHSNAPAMHLLGLNHHIEVDYIEATEVGYLIWCKNEAGDYPCDSTYMWPARIHDITLHHLYGHTLWQDGMYIGSSDPYGVSRGVQCSPIVPESITMPSVGASVTCTVDAGEFNIYRTGDTFSLELDGSNWMAGTITAYNNTNGSLTFQVTATGGTGSGTGWIPKIYRRPAGLENIIIHDVTLDWVGRSGIQWGAADQGTNKIYNCSITNCGTELNDQQGCGIAFGSASNSCEIYNNTIAHTYKNALFSYHYGNLYVHDNNFSDSGHVPAGMFHAEGTLPNQSAIYVNIYNSQNPGPTKFDIYNNTIATYTDTYAIKFDATNNNYGSPNYIVSNTINGSAQTSGHIYVNPGASTLTYSTTYP